MEVVLLPFRSPNQTSIVHVNGWCGRRAGLTEISPRLPMHSSSFLGETHHGPERVKMCRLHGNVFALSLGGEYDTGTSMCLPGSRPPTVVPHRSMEETSIPTCSGTIKKVADEHEKYVEDMRNLPTRSVWVCVSRYRTTSSQPLRLLPPFPLSRLT